VTQYCRANERLSPIQIVLLGRVGLVLALLQSSSDSLLKIEKLRWIAKEAARLRFLVDDSQRQGDVWLPAQLLACVSSVNDLKRAFVAFVRKAWPTALIEAALARSTPATSGSGLRYRRLAVAHASIVEPSVSTSAKQEPREITANWPFQQRVRLLLTNVRDTTQVYVKSVLPNGDVAYHHVPASSVRHRGPRKHSVDYTISLTVSPFTDPTAFSVAACLGHPTLPGSVKVSKADPSYCSESDGLTLSCFTCCAQPTTPGSGDTSPRMFTAISAAVGVPIFHRTSSTLRLAAARPSA
jgi:hypothetical protein